MRRKSFVVRDTGVMSLKTHNMATGGSQILISLSVAIPGFYPHPDSRFYTACKSQNDEGQLPCYLAAVLSCVCDPSALREASVIAYNQETLKSFLAFCIFVTIK